jgi:hypothetical protein
MQKRIALILCILSLYMVSIARAQDCGRVKSNRIENTVWYVLVTVDGGDMVHMVTSDSLRKDTSLYLYRNCTCGVVPDTNQAYCSSTIASVRNNFGDLFEIGNFSKFASQVWSTKEMVFDTIQYCEEFFVDTATYSKDVPIEIRETSWCAEGDLCISTIVGSATLTRQGNLFLIVSAGTICEEDLLLDSPVYYKNRLIGTVSHVGPADGVPNTRSIWINTFMRKNF